jgi:hypothetical protein
LQDRKQILLQHVGELRDELARVKLHWGLASPIEVVWRHQVSVVQPRFLIFF